MSTHIYHIATIHNPLLQSSTYVIHDSHTAYLVDCGEAELIIRYLRENRLTLFGIFLTHCHYDHIYGLNEVMHDYPQAIVYCHPLAKENINNRKFNLYFTFSQGEEYRFLYLQRLHDVNVGSDLAIFGRKMEILETEGHTSDSLSFLYDGNLFTGDAYNPDYRLSASWPNSNKKMAIQHEEELKRMVVEKHFMLYPGHWK